MRGFTVLKDFKTVFGNNNGQNDRERQHSGTDEDGRYS